MRSPKGLCSEYIVAIRNALTTYDEHQPRDLNEWAEQNRLRFETIHEPEGKYYVLRLVYSRLKVVDNRRMRNTRR